jgi:hypothetical protein
MQNGEFRLVAVVVRKDGRLALNPFMVFLGSKRENVTTTMLQRFEGFAILRDLRTPTTECPSIVHFSSSQGTRS